ncbi:MAG TPA: hypothetical protein VFO16_23325 [Pseudonocardiaceae bacterium]|nr:hypothetical protein [Pseudonocardiaceae bacterium]
MRTPLGEALAGGGLCLGAERAAAPVGPRPGGEYAGAMLLHAFLDWVGAEGVLSGACGQGVARYDDLGSGWHCISWMTTSCPARAPNRWVGGWNTKRRHAQRGREDTLVADYHGRAVCFASGEPAGLSSSLPGALAQLRQVLGEDTPIMLGFDRGGSYPVVFRACRDARADWLTWAAAPWPGPPPRRSARSGPAPAVAARPSCWPMRSSRFPATAGPGS